MKQTAVGFLFAHLLPHLDWSTTQNKILFRQLEQEALNMEKEQIIDAWVEGECSVKIEGDSEGCDIFTEGTSEQYYNETYGSKGSDETNGNFVEEVPNVTSSQTEISIGDIDNASYDYACNDHHYYGVKSVAFQEGAK